MFAQLVNIWLILWFFLPGFFMVYLRSRRYPYSHPTATYETGFIFLHSMIFTVSAFLTWVFIGIPVSGVVSKLGLDWQRLLEEPRLYFSTNPESCIFHFVLITALLFLLPLLYARFKYNNLKFSSNEQSVLFTELLDSGMCELAQKRGLIGPLVTLYTRNNWVVYGELSEIESAKNEEPKFISLRNVRIDQQLAIYSNSDKQIKTNIQLNRRASLAIVPLNDVSSIEFGYIQE